MSEGLAVGWSRECFTQGAIFCTALILGWQRQSSARLNYTLSRVRPMNVRPHFTVRSLLFSTVVVALLATVVALQQKYHHNSAVERFNNSLSNPRLTVSPTALSKALSQRRTQVVLSAAAAANSRIIVDGERFAQIHHQGYRDSQNYSDTVVLTRIGSSNSCDWYGPIGTQIKSIAFAANGVRVFVYGDLDLDGNVQHVPIEDSHELLIPWSSGDEPSSGTLHKRLRLSGSE